MDLENILNLTPWQNVLEKTDANERKHFKYFKCCIVWPHVVPCASLLQLVFSKAIQFSLKRVQVEVIMVSLSYRTKISFNFFSVYSKDLLQQNLPNPFFNCPKSLSQPQSGETKRITSRSQSRVETTHVMRRAACRVARERFCYDN